MSPTVTIVLMAGWFSPRLQMSLVVVKGSPGVIYSHCCVSHRMVVCRCHLELRGYLMSPTVTVMSMAGWMSADVTWKGVCWAFICRRC